MNQKIILNNLKIRLKLRIANKHGSLFGKLSFGISF